MVDVLKFKNGGNIWFTSDTHFNHANIMRFCNRPFKTVQEMDLSMVDNWNNAVGKDDIIFHLGDFCLGGAAEWTKMLDRLNGKIYLILGNHDLKNIRQGFINRFEHVAMQMFIEVGKQKIYLNHNPFLCYGGAYKDIWQLFGHVHSGPFNTGRDKPRLENLFPLQYDVGVDNNYYTPVSFYQLRDIMTKNNIQNRQKPEAVMEQALMQAEQMLNGTSDVKILLAQQIVQQQKNQARLDELEALVRKPKDILTLEEAADFLGFRKSYLYKLVFERKIPHFKPFGKLIYFERTELENLTCWLN